MKNEISKIEFDVCKAHNNMVDKKVDGGSKKQVIAFLKKQKVPFDWDVRGGHWDGVTWETSAHYTGDEFLKDPDCCDHVIDHQKHEPEPDQPVRYNGYNNY